MLEYLQEHTQEVVIDKATFVLVVDILRSALGDTQPALDAIANLAAEELVPGGRDGQVMYRRQGAEILQIFCITRMKPGLVFLCVRHQYTALIALTLDVILFSDLLIS